jgi:cardiolipin synthase A/B
MKSALSLYAFLQAQCAQLIKKVYRLWSAKCGTKVKRSSLFCFILAALCCLLVSVYTSFRPQLPTRKEPLVFYSPASQNSLKWVLLSSIKKAKTSIFISAFSFDDLDIIQAIEKKAKKGLTVRVFYDPKHTYTKLFSSNVVYIPKTFSGLAHRKVLMIDDMITFFGTANFTESSLEMHANSIVGIYSPDLSKWLTSACLGLKKSSTFVSSDFSVHLLPNHEAANYIIEIIDQSKRSIHLAQFSLSHPQIIDAINRAKLRGVQLEGVVDRSVRRDLGLRGYSRLGLMHQKLALIDEETLIIGSANWTKSAFIKNEDLFAVIHISHQNLENVRKTFQLLKAYSRKNTSLESK